MWSARAWNRSRDLEVLAVAVTWLRAMLDDKARASRVLDTLPGYVPEPEPPGAHDDDEDD